MKKNGSTVADIKKNGNKTAVMKKNLTIPVLAPVMRFQSDRFAYALAAKYAMELINNRTDILKDYHLVPVIYDTIVSELSCYFDNQIYCRFYILAVVVCLLITRKTFIRLS
jgi:hypothetical protein